MRTAIYWTARHCRGAVRQRQFCLRCWWLSQQVDFLDWRLRLEPILFFGSSRADLVAMGQGECHAVQSP